LDATVTIFGHLVDWQAARNRARLAGRRRLPAITKFMDPTADLLVAVSRLLIGAVMGWALHGQFIGASAAIAVGASGPALLRQFAASHRVREAVAASEGEAIDSRPGASTNVVAVAVRRQDEPAEGSAR